MLSVLLPLTARAQVVDPTLPVALDSEEMTGMGGAGIALARGAPGLLYHPAAPAWRLIEETAPFVGSTALDWMRIGPDEPVDIGNVGLTDAERASGGLVTGGLTASYGHIGGGVAASSLIFQQGEALVAVTEGHAGLSMTTGDQVSVGAGARLLWVEVLDGESRGTYLGAGAEAGGLLSHARSGWNFAFALRSPVRASIGEHTTVPIDTVVMPWQVVTGVAGAGRAAPASTRTRPLRLAADLILDGPVANAVALEPLLVGLAVEKGAAITASPHLGLEIEPLPERLKVRVGGYREPARTTLSAPRVHGTTGLELKLFHLTIPCLIDHDITWEAAVDIADRYTNISWLGIGLWHQGVVGPSP